MLVRGVVAPILILAATASGARAAGPFDARLPASTAELHARGRTPEAAAPLAALLRLEERLAPGALVPVLRDTVSGNVHPLVAAQAAFALAMEEERAGDDAGAKRR